jgi:hypothetical protein
MADTRPDLRDLLGRAPIGVVSNLHQTMVIACWENAKSRFEQQGKASAEAEASGIPKHRLKADLKSLRRAYVDAHGKMPDDEIPANCYLERILAIVEEDEFEAETLREVLPKDSAEDTDFQTRLATDGSIRVKAIRKSGKLPNDAEELRRCLKIMSHGWQAVKLRHSNRTWLQTISDRVFDKHVTYLLGPHVMGLVAKDASGNVVHRPPFALIIAYEQRIREKAFTLMEEEDADFAKAFESARNDPITKERYFTTALAIRSHGPTEPPAGGGGGKGRIDLQPNETSRAARNKKRKLEMRARLVTRKGKKGKGKGKTPDGEMVCFRYNSAQGCKGECRFKHCCSICFAANHNETTCTAGGG